MRHKILPLLLLSCGACKLAEPPSHDDLQEASAAGEAAAEWKQPTDPGMVDDGWIHSFGDEELVALVEEAQRENPGLQVAAAQVERAAGAAKLGAAALVPTVNVAANVTGDSVPGGPVSGVGVNASWEADVWGRVRAGAAVAEESLRATESDYQYARQSLAAAVAKSWFLATEARLQLELATETAENRAELLELVETREEIGAVSEQDINLAKAALATSRSAERDARNAADQARRSLEILLGRYPSAELEAANDLAAVPPPIPTGVPSEVLERRPDILAAERRVRAAFFATEQADLARLPRLSLTGGVGINSISDTVASLGAGLVGPLFDPSIQAQIDIATADQKAAIAAYGQAALAAFKDVENALGNESALSAREELSRLAAEQNQSAFEKTSAQYEVGSIDFLTVLQDQSRVFASRVQLLRIRSERLLTRVNLHLALGGSFELTSEPTDG